VHNSGHWTLDGASVSQFEQHIRAVTGWPLGKPIRRGRVEMTNLIGSEVEDYRRVLDRPDIDAVLIGTPDHWHAIQQAELFWRVGTHPGAEPRCRQYGDNRRHIEDSRPNPIQGAEKVKSLHLSISLKPIDIAPANRSKIRSRLTGIWYDRAR